MAVKFKLSTEKEEEAITVEATKRKIILSQSYGGDFVRLSARQFNELKIQLRKKGLGGGRQ